MIEGQWQNDLSPLSCFVGWQQCKIIGMHDGRILPFDSVMPSSKIQFLHTKNDNEKWIGFFVPMLQWMSHSETNGIRSSAIWHLTLILPCFFVRQKQFGTLERRILDWKTPKWHEGHVLEELNGESVVLKLCLAVWIQFQL